MFQKNRHSKQASDSYSKSGYVAISIVLILSVISIAVAVTVAQLGIGEGQTSLSHSKGEETLHFVEGCLEDALLKLRASASYAGGTISRPEGSCTITVSSVATTYTVTATTTATTYRRSVQAVVVRGSSAVTLSSWKEL